MKKAIPRSAVADVYKSIQNDLIYADNLSAIAAQREELQVAVHFTLLENLFVR
jgi:hypothetical protein